MNKLIILVLMAAAIVVASTTLLSFIQLDELATWWCDLYGC